LILRAAGGGAQIDFFSACFEAYAILGKKTAKNAHFFQKWPISPISGDFGTILGRFCDPRWRPIWGVEGVDFDLTSELTRGSEGVDFDLISELRRGLRMSISPLKCGDLGFLDGAGSSVCGDFREKIRAGIGKTETEKGNQGIWDRKNRERKKGDRDREQGTRTGNENREQGLLPLVYVHSASFPVSPSDLTHNYRIIRESCTSVPPIKTPSFILLIHYKPYHNPLA